MASEMGLLYVHCTTGHFSRKALQAICNSPRNIILLECSGMDLWAPRLAAIPSLWRKQLRTPKIVKLPQACFCFLLGDCMPVP